MSKFDIQYLNDNIRVGFVAQRGRAWWDTMGTTFGSHYDDAVPVEVATELIGFKPSESRWPIPTGTAPAWCSSSTR